MAKKTDGMSDNDLVSLLDRAISTATDHADQETAQVRQMATKFINGEVDFPSEEGKSSVVSHDVADTLHWILPSLLRVFMGAENVGIYEPRRQDMVEEVVQDPQTGQPVPRQRDVSDERASQATDYVNYVLLNECRGYSILHSALYDALAYGNGIIKHWYDDTPQFITQTYANLSEDAFARLVGEDEVEVLEHTAKDDPSYEPPPGLPTQEELEDATKDAIANGIPEADAQMALEQALEQIAAPQVHDLKIKRRVSEGRLMVKAMPHEEFFIGPDDTVIDEEETLLCGHTYLETRSNLIEQGYSREKVAELPSAAERDEDETKFLRRGDLDDPETDWSTEQVRIYECYIRCDYDGDGVAELRKVVLAGLSGGRHILDNDEWGDDLPFTDLVPDPVPHRWRGRSLYEETGDIQRIKTVLMRQTLDNLYAVNNPMTVVPPRGVHNMEQLVNRELGALIFADDPNLVKDLTVPFVAQQSFGMLEYMDSVREQRTGVSRASMGLDQEALQNQTATAFNGAQSAAYAKMETYARNISEMGLKRLFKCLLKLLVTRQDKERMIRLRGKWVEMNPENWQPDMDVVINTGLGSGSRDRDLSMLNNILNEQKAIIAQSGPMNPIVDVRRFRDTLAKMVEIAGLRSPERFFGEITDEEWAKMQEQAAQPQQNPEMAEAQAKIAADQAKQQADFQLEQQKAQAKFEMDRQKQQSDLVLEREKAQAKLEIERWEATARMNMRREEMMLEAGLTAEVNATRAAQGWRAEPDVNINGGNLG